MTTPTLAQVINDIIENRLCDLHVSLPAKVISYDEATGFASVQPLIKRKFKTQTTAVDLPVINNVPVIFQRTTKAWVVMPVAKDDVGHLLVSERSLDRWKSFGGSQDPKDTRKHDLTDAVFILGGYPKNDPMIGVVSGALHLKNDKAEVILLADGSVKAKNDISDIQFTPTGKILLKGAGSKDLVDLQSQHLDADIAHTHATAVGASSPPVNVAVYQSIKAFLDAMKV